MGAEKQVFKKRRGVRTDFGKRGKTGRGTPEEKTEGKIDPVEGETKDCGPNNNPARKKRPLVEKPRKFPDT